MDAPIIAALVGIFGIGAIGAFGLVFTMLRTGIRDNSEAIKDNREGIKDNGERIGRLEVAFGRLEERVISEFGQIKDVLVRIEATQAEQGRQIEKLSGGDLP